MPQFYLPTRIVSGRGCLAALGTECAAFGQRVMLVCGARSARASGLLGGATSSLTAAGLSVTLFDQVHREADLATVAQGINLARQEAVEAVVGLGGGSAMDTAKAIAGLTPLSGSAAEYHAGRSLEGPGLPFVAIPTTAGTGAEATKNAVLIDPDTMVKKSIRDDSWFARVALLDPKATVSMPPAVTASTGSDALCQAIESYTSIAATPLTDALAIRAIALVGQNLERAYTHGEDLEAREKVLMGSLLAGMALANARLGGVHGMAHPLGSHFEIPHGVICGLLLPYTMQYNLAYAEAKYAQVAQLLRNDVGALSQARAGQCGVDLVRELLERIGIPMRLAPFGVRPEHLDQIIAESMPSGSLKHNPRPLTPEDVRAILEQAL